MEKRFLLAHHMALAPLAPTGSRKLLKPGETSSKIKETETFTGGALELWTHEGSSISDIIPSAQTLTPKAWRYHRYVLL